MVFHEGALQGMGLLTIGEALDGADLGAIALDGEHQAGAHRGAVDDHGAGAANAVLASEVGSGLAAFLADDVGQRAARLHADGVSLAVDGQRDVVLGVHDAACSRARNASVATRSRR